MHKASVCCIEFRRAAICDGRHHNLVRHIRLEAIGQSAPEGVRGVAWNFGAVRVLVYDLVCDICAAAAVTQGLVWLKSTVSRTAGCKNLGGWRAHQAGIDCGRGIESEPIVTRPLVYLQQRAV